MKKILFFGFLIITAMIFVSCIALPEDLLNGDTGIYKPTSSELTGKWTFSFDFTTYVQFKLNEFDFNDELIVTFDFTEGTFTSKLNGSVDSFVPTDINTIQEVNFDSFTIKTDGTLSIIFNTQFNNGTVRNYYLTGTATNLSSGTLGNIYGTFTVDPDIYVEDSFAYTYLVPDTFSATRIN